MDFKSDYQRLKVKYQELKVKYNEVKKMNTVLMREKEDSEIDTIRTKTLILNLLHAHYECDQYKINKYATKLAKLINPDEWIEYRVKLGYIDIEKIKKKESR